MELESLRFRWWFSRPCTFFKTQIHGIPEYLLNEIPKIQIHYNTRNTDHVEIYYCNMDIFYIFFFPFAINGWSILDLDVLKSKSYAIFLNTLWKLCRPNQCVICSINNPVWFKLFNHLRLVWVILISTALTTTFKNALILCEVATWNWINFSFFAALPSLYKHAFNSFNQYGWNYE